MGFFDFVNRMANGEPVFQEENSAAQKPPAPVTEKESEAAIRKGVESSFPVVQIKRATSHSGGDHLQVYCHIENSWPEAVELDKIYIFNTKRELDTLLRGHEEREFLVYEGSALTKEYHEVKLDYKTQKEGDYFEAVHTAHFSYRPQDKTFEVGDIRLSEPIRDIYG